MSDAITRQLDLLRFIPHHPRTITTTDLKSKLESEGHSVGIRTIQRDLEKLTTKFPLVKDANKPAGWFWMEGSKQPDIPRNPKQLKEILSVPKFDNDYLGGIKITCPKCGGNECHILSSFGQMGVLCHYCGTGFGSFYLDDEELEEETTTDGETFMGCFAETGYFNTIPDKEIKAFREKVQNKLAKGIVVNEAYYTTMDKKTGKWYTEYLVKASADYVCQK